MAATLALAGDTMLGRKVGERLEEDPHAALVDDAVAEWLAGADLTVLNLECCISARGERWTDPGKPFFFRAPPHAANRLAELGVDAVTLANNHALDFGPVALADTLAHLDEAGIDVVGAGADLTEARRPRSFTVGGQRLVLIGVSDHPADFAAGPDVPGIAHAAMRRDLPAWLRREIADADADLVAVTPHWGPNMVGEPVRDVRDAASSLAAAGAGLIAGHSAHVPHGVGAIGRTVVCYDLGDLLDDYAVHPRLRNDLGFVWRVTLDAGRPRRVEALPIALEYCYTRAAQGDDAAWVRRRLLEQCASLGVTARQEEGMVVVDLDASGLPQ